MPLTLPTENTQALTHRRTIPSPKKASTDEITREGKKCIETEKKRGIAIIKHFSSIASRFHHYWNKPLCVCSLINICKACAIIVVFIIIIFMVFLHYGHLITCKYHMALCTPYIYYLKNYDNVPSSDAFTAVDYELKQQIICQKLPPLSTTFGAYIGLILTDTNTKTKSWIKRLAEYDAHIHLMHVAVKENMNKCSDLMDVINKKTEIFSFDVDDHVSLFEFEIMDNGNNSFFDVFYRCLAHVAYCNQLTVIDLIQYDDNEGTIGHKYQQMIQFYPLGLIYLHIIPNGHEFDRFYFDMALQLAGYSPYELEQ